MKAQDILATCQLLRKEDCKIVDDVLYEKCTFMFPFQKEEFVNSEDETYYLEGSNHVYRFFFSDDDYDYVTDPVMLLKLNELFMTTNPLHVGGCV